MLRVVLFSLLVSRVVIACTTNGDCGSSDNTQSGRCVSGVCQCGIGFSGNQLIDPTSCSLQCSPAAVPDSVAFLIEPNVTVAADSGNLVLSVDMLPYLKQSPASVSLLNPNNGTACALMPQQLGTGKWAQSVLNDASQCGLRYVFSSAFAATVGQACWDAQAPTTETGSQYSVTFNSYKTQVEVVQQGLAPFGQAAARATTTSETSITRVFRRDYTISVATQFSPTTAPTSGALFQSVTLSSLAVVQQTSNGPQNLGNQLAATFLTLLSPAQQTSPSNPVWNFDLLIDPAFFGLTNVYYLEATLDLVFTNTGPLTKRLRIPLTSLSMLRQQANVELVALNSRAIPTALSQGGIFSQTFRLTASSSSSSASVSTSSSGTVSAVQSSNSSSSTVAIAVGVAVVAAVLCAAGIVIAVVIVRRRKQEQRGRASSDAPLTAVVSSIPSTIFVDAE